MVEKAETGRRWEVGGWHCGTAPVDDGLKTYFWPQMKVLVCAKDTEDVPKTCCYSWSSFSFPQSCLKASLLQE